MIPHFHAAGHSLCQICWNVFTTDGNVRANNAGMRVQTILRENTWSGHHRQCMRKCMEPPLPMVQHNDMRLSNQSRYNKDRGIFVGWFQVHPQFVGYDTDCLVSLSTGIVADTSVDCDNAVELETISAQNKTIKVRGRNMEVNLTIVFNSITCDFNSSSEMELLSSELAPQLPFLFQRSVMRKTATSSLSLPLKYFIQQSNLLVSVSHIFRTSRSIMEINRLWCLMDIVAQLQQR
ncbi:hypothetical protein GQR58_019970 [Nymphon striatum]|nr:hypothetical protein GQR58_019970 [Nymphon striatum]